MNLCDSGLAGWQRLWRIVAACWVAASLGAARASSAPPNVVFVLTDQWRASATGYGGDPNVRTPHLDQLARQSINFRNGVSVCPVCTPYRAALLTGRYPTSTGMFLNDIYLPDEEVCLAELFAAAGYATAYIGKWHLDGHGRDSFVPPARRQGFEYWKAAECDHDYNHSHYYTGRSPEKKFWPGYDAYAETEDAVRFLRDRGRVERPFLLFVSYGTPHFPHASAPAELQAMYPPDQLQLPANVPPQRHAQVRRELQGYYAHCTALDRCVGQLVAALAQTGMAENTILVFTADHGEVMGAHGCQPCLKQYPYDESIRVPFLVRYPAVHGDQGRVVDAPINTPDILPTLLGLAKLPIPATVEGEDLSGVVRSGSLERDRAALVMSVSPFSRNHPMDEYRGIRTARYTYVRNLEGPWLLFDNQRDPLQQNNLVDQSEYAALRANLENQLGQQLRRIGDEFQPREFYVRKWGYRVTSTGIVPYQGKNEPQGPSLNRKAK